jgi:hypothetical protein
VNPELDCLHRMMVLGQRQTPPAVLHIAHFPKLREDNVCEGFFEHDKFLRLRDAAPDRLKVPVAIADYTGMRLGLSTRTSGKIAYAYPIAKPRLRSPVSCTWQVTSSMLC